MKEYPFVIVNTHPIQYFAPLYREMAKIMDNDFCVVYASKRGVEKGIDQEFNSSFQWDIDLTSGYKHFFIDEAKSNMELDSFNIKCKSLSEYLKMINPQIILVHGYADPAAKTALKWAIKNQRKILLRGDSWLLSGRFSSNILHFFKKKYLQTTLIPYVDKFLAVGKRNFEYWRSLGARDYQIELIPFGIDNNRFYAIEDDTERQVIIEKYNLPTAKKIIGFAGKFIEKKGIYQLLVALTQSDLPLDDAIFVLTGDGSLRENIGKLKTNGLLNMEILGFRNQSEMPDLYRVFDLMLMPSQFSETWGFALQEALACATPVLASNMVGCAPDFIIDGKSGLILPYNNFDRWCNAIRDFVAGNIVFDRKYMREISRDMPDFAQTARKLSNIVGTMLS